MEEALRILRSMRSNALQNYVLPGLRSSLIGGLDLGRVRLFEQTRDNVEHGISPHSHRFDFACLVLEGGVENRIWTEDDCGDEYQVMSVDSTGTPGQIATTPGRVARFRCTYHEYGENEWYYMKAEQIHSIQFDAGTTVLFFEGPERFVQSIMLAPVVNGRTLDTCGVAPWMFQPEDLP